MAAVVEAPTAFSPVVMAFNKVKESALHVFSQRKPMSEILDRNSYQRPASFGEATTRMQKNLNYFKVSE